jgi:hypothetical protein
LAEFVVDVAEDNGRTKERLQTVRRRIAVMTLGGKLQQGW